jgi:hypothetical protein
MNLKWKPGSDPRVLINHINQEWNKKSIEQGFASIFITEYQSLLIHSLINFPPEIPDFLGLNIIKSYLYKSITTKNTNPDKLLQAISAELELYLRQELKKYVVFTSLSIPQTIKINPYYYNNSTIRFCDTKKNLFSINAKGVIDRAKIGFRCEVPSNYLPVRITVNARSFEESFPIAENTLNVFRALANFALKFNQITVSTGPSDPINKIVTGPIHTIHYTNGKNVDPEIWWYENAYSGQITHLISNQDVYDKMIRFVRMATRRLIKHPYRVFLEDVLIRYVQAMDSRDPLATSLKLWGIIESLTGSEDRKSDKLISRATFFFKDRKYYTWELNHLREFRNLVTHHGKSTPNEESYAYLFKKYADVLIRFHLLNNFHFDSIHEAFDLLDAPSDLKLISSKEKNLRISKKIFSKSKDG